MFESHLIALLLLTTCFGLSFSRSSEVCSYLRREAEETCSNQSVTSSVQGPPGKRGPSGPPGPKGSQGIQGVCNCSLEQILNVLREAPHLNNQYNGAWVQIDLKTPYRVTGVVTQGRPRGDLQHILSYKISYGNQTNLQILQDASGNDVIFQGNRERNTHVTNKFAQPVIARYFRVISYTYRDVPIVRIELITC